MSRPRTIGLLATLPLAILVAPLAAEAQLPRTIPRIAYLSLSPGPCTATCEGFVRGLRELGYVEGKNIIMEYRWSAGNVERLREHAAELVRVGVHVIVTGGPVATRAAQDMTRLIPIVMARDRDPVGDGFVASRGQPGGDITGVTPLSRELTGKQLELLKDTVPGLARVAVLYNPVEVSAARQLRDTEDAARVRLVPYPAGRVLELERKERHADTFSQGESIAYITWPFHPREVDNAEQGSVGR
jgi:putative ABC transport system substrate-binding protein